MPPIKNRPNCALERRGLRRIRDYTLRSVVVADESPSNDIEPTELYALERCGLQRIRGYTLRSVVVADESPSNGQSADPIIPQSHTNHASYKESTELRFGASRATEDKGLYASERSGGG
ncbi:hypothetical protein BDBG_09058 [Blastomyces gilchristii SLH14081]|uniref:Uncharacterized protein n=1 Tax=Blastomyces gilchristii (strain SLH14081) TaxID=559298 RepID=A0A179V1I2_BLAGS|nr:uncharacterized protein BDBG_09058 [Blastomyces gilchristii SLH14081]OAT13950.1 hypothetical protein BDBG_09058 [Blastomyces gilchristii SLH14081]